MTTWISKISSGIAIAGWTWLLLSWADVVVHNSSDYVYAGWNLFTIIF